MYDDITYEQLKGMDAKERADYYHDLYKTATKLLFMIADPNTEANIIKHTYDPDDLGHWGHMSLHHAVMGVSDLLVGMTDYYQAKMDAEEEI